MTRRAPELSSRIRVFGVLLLLLGPLPCAAQREPLDPAQGVIDGRRAMALMPLRFEGNKAVEVLDPAGCRALLSSKTTYETFERPCGEWFLVPADRYDYWLEREGEISPFTRKVIYTRGPFEGRGMLGGQGLGPAGRVQLPAPEELGLELRLLHLGSPEVGGLLQGAITKRLALPAAVPTTQMPVGSTLAALWSHRAGRYEALSRPFDTVAGDLVAPPPALLAEGRCHLIAQIVRHETLARRADDTLEITLRRGSEDLPPEVKLATQESVYAVWYDLPVGPVEVRARARKAQLEPVAIVLETGRISGVLATMAAVSAGPSLEVGLDLPSPLFEAEVELRLRRLPQGEGVLRRTIERTEASLRFEDLPRAVLQVELATRLGPFTTQVDLTSGQDAYVLLAPEPIVVRGQVLRGGEGLAVDLTFTGVQRHSQEVASDPEGHYEIVTLEPLRSVSIEQRDGSMPPLVEFFPDPLDRTGQRDFHIPESRFRIRVVDALTGRPIPEAQVVSRNRFTGEAAEEGQPGREMATMQRVTTDQEGVAWLPPLRPGRVEVTARAEGYVPMSEAAEKEVEEEAEGHLDLTLEPLGEMVSLRLRLPSGAAAEGAEVALVDGAGSIFLERRADAEGLVALPRNHPALALVRHPQTAFDWRPWDPSKVEEGSLWGLALSPGPLQVRVMDSWGKDPSPRARIVLWCEGTLLADAALFWLTHTRPMADPAGYWHIERPPRRPLGIVAWGMGAGSGTSAMTSEPLATFLSPPFPELVEIRALDR